MKAIADHILQHETIATLYQNTPELVAQSRYDETDEWHTVNIPQWHIFGEYRLLNAAGEIVAYSPSYTF